MKTTNKLQKKPGVIQKDFTNKAYMKYKTFRLKKAITIVFKYNAYGKKILFVGTPIKLNKNHKKLLKNTGHTFIPEKIWLNGVLTNSKYIFRSLIKKCSVKRKSNLKFLFNLINKYNLIVFLNNTDNTSPYTEFFKKRIPVISVSCNNLDNYLTTYKIISKTTSFSNKNFDRVFCFLLGAFLKKNADLAHKIK